MTSLFRNMYVADLASGNFYPENEFSTQPSFSK